MRLSGGSHTPLDASRSAEQKRKSKESGTEAHEESSAAAWPQSSESTTEYAELTERRARPRFHANQREWVGRWLNREAGQVAVRLSSSSYQVMPTAWPFFASSAYSVVPQHFRKKANLQSLVARRRKGSIGVLIDSHSSVALVLGVSKHSSCCLCSLGCLLFVAFFNDEAYFTA